MAGGRFNPAQHALVLSQNGNLEPPLTAAERHAYSKGLEEVTRTKAADKPQREEASWDRLLANARMELDQDGRPVLRIQSGEALIEIGITRNNVLRGSAPRELAQELLVARVREQLRSGGPPKTSAAELRKDWQLLKTAFTDRSENIAAQLTFRVSGQPDGTD